MPFFKHLLPFYKRRDSYVFLHSFQLLRSFFLFNIIIFILLLCCLLVPLIAIKNGLSAVKFIAKHLPTQLFLSRLKLHFFFLSRFSRNFFLYIPLGIIRKLCHTLRERGSEILWQLKQNQFL